MNRPKDCSKELSQARLKEVLDYDPESGIFTWRHTRAKKVKGAVAGYVEKDGYHRIMVDYYPRQAHRLAFLWMTGSVPEFIDHKDGDRSNNKWSNLRPATRSQNMANSKARPSLAGLRGVGFDPTRSMPYVARIRINGCRAFLGRFATADEAHRAYVRAAKKHFGEFARVA